MELQFDKSVCHCMRQVAWEIQNQEQTQEVRLPDGLPDIGRVLTAWGQVILRSKEWRGNGMSASGGVMARVMYAPEDDSEPRCIDTWIPFQSKWDFPETEREGTIRVVPLLRGIDARTISARKMMVRASIGVLGEALVPWETEIFAPAELPEGVELLRHTYPLKLAMEAGEKAFLLDEELSLPASCPAADKIVHFEMQPQLQDQKVMAGRVVFRGTGLLHVLYRCQNGEYAAWDFEIPFSQIGELEEETGTDAQARITIAVTSLELELSDDGVFRLKCGLVAQYVVCGVTMIELAEDAYSPCRNVSPKVQELELPAVLDERMDMIPAEQVVPIEDGSVVDINFLPDFPRCNRMDDRIEMELPGIFQVLYADNEGHLQGTSVRWNGNVEMNTGMETQTHLEIVPSGRAQVTAASGTVAARGNVSLFLLTMSDKGLMMMSGMEIGEKAESDAERPSLILRRAGGEPLWDMAKRCGSTVAAIRQANAIEDEPAEGQMLLIPVQ